MLYLRGISPGEVHEALAAPGGQDGPNPSPSVVSRLTGEWQQKRDRWRRRDLSARSSVHVRADGVDLQARTEPAAECMRVVLGATPEGRAELVGFQVGPRESTRDAGASFWLTSRPGACGFRPRSLWATQPWGSDGRSTTSSRGRAIQDAGSKTANVLVRFPKSMQPAVRTDPRDIGQADTRAAAEIARNTCAENYAATYGRAVPCLTREREALRAFYDLPRERRDHLRRGIPIGSMFATVRHRTVRTRGALSPKTAKLMVFTFVQGAAGTCCQRRLKTGPPNR